MSTASKESTTRSRSNTKRVAALTATKRAAPRATAKPAPAKTARATPPKKPRPIPREVRTAAAALAALGDPVRLELLGMLAAVGADGQVTLDAIAARFGLDAAIVTRHLGVLKKRGWIEAIRGDGGWDYRATATGETASLRARTFNGGC